ncbi:hypothetical protein GRI89_09615 [Altererythrobacter salegens]|uniref:Copper-binding protein n=1 Tax=Croceibacterium salegens TaxID=1737568 RepID=A0A6I4SY66_9SPHN|nr:DUF6152 family protein [Croceibacterium salegens]MXO59796.1 hypothetical protein [Croceibacterium salegens]
MRKMMAALALMGATLATSAADAHHSFGMFDMTKEVTITGKVRKFQWTNPHSYIQLTVTDASGKEVEYSLEMGAPMYLYARGWRPATLKPGMMISVKLSPLRNGEPGGVVRDVLTPDGKPIGTNQ